MESNDPSFDGANTIIREEKTSRKDMGCDVIWNWSAYYIFTLGAVMKETRNSEKKTKEAYCKLMNVAKSEAVRKAINIILNGYEPPTNKLWSGIEFLSIREISSPV